MSHRSSPSVPSAAPCASTCGVAGVDDAEHLGAAVLATLGQRPPQLGHVQGPALVLVQEVVDLDGAELGDGRRVQGVLGDGDHHPRARRPRAGHQQLQDVLGGGGRGVMGVGTLRGGGGVETEVLGMWVVGT